MSGSRTLVRGEEQLLVGPPKIEEATKPKLDQAPDNLTIMVEAMEVEMVQSDRLGESTVSHFLAERTVPVK